METFRITAIACITFGEHNNAEVPVTFVVKASDFVEAGKKALGIMKDTTLSFRRVEIL